MKLEDQLIMEQIQVGPMQNFAYLIGDRQTRQIAVVDPAWDIAGLTKMIAEREYKLTGVKKVTGFSSTDLKTVASGDKLKIGDIEVEFLHTPGHTPGSQCFRVRNTLVSGDTLFVDGCGRVDLPGSNSEDMYHSLQKLAGLPDDTLLLPGHNYSAVPHATLAETKRTNTYMRINDLSTWKMMMGS